MKTIRNLFLLIVLLISCHQYGDSQSINSIQINRLEDTHKFNNSIFGKNSYVFEPTMDMLAIQTLLDTIYNQQSGKKSEFTKNRVALFFKPGTYHLDVKTGYYMQVYGLGESPDDVVIIGAVRSKSTQKSGNVLSNFWRSAENLAEVPTIDSAVVWGVSQAAPLRRIHVRGDLQLHDHGYASGGFMADCRIDGTVFSGQQQQWFSRNTEWSHWVGGAWNMMFMGVTNSPEGIWPKRPFTVIKETPFVREKPYLIFNRNGYSLRIPAAQQNTIGTSWNKASKDAKTISLKEFYLANAETDNSGTINAALQRGKNILFTPGIYSMDKSLKVSRPGTIIAGIGMATLQSTHGNAILEISDVDNVTVYGLIIDAGKIHSETLLRVGDNKSGIDHSKNPTFIYDVYFRVGGPMEGSASSCMIVNSHNVFIDNSWLWRADHGNGVGWELNKGANGLIVNGDHVTAYGLFIEHFQEYQTLWNGNHGKVYFYQSEMPYDTPTVEAWSHDGIHGYASYKVSDKVTSHEAWGVGVYCVFHHAPVQVDDAIETPVTLEQNIHHTVTFWLSGNKESSIQHIINQKGEMVNASNKKATLN